MNKTLTKKNRLLIESITVLSLLAGLVSAPSFGQDQSSGAVLDVGIRLQKALSLYTENGVTVQYTNPKLIHKRLYVGASYVSSRLGTALGTNAIRQDNFLLNLSYFFRPKWLIQPVFRANVGYFRADYGSPIFDELPKTSLLASPEFGLCYCSDFPLKVIASLGLNVITGNGLTGPGTLYPVFIQTSITWDILKKR